jgi:hypothetical protein
MKITYCLAIALLLCITACQKSADPIMGGNDPAEDSTIIPGDTIKYEVISADTSGWYGMWMDEQSRLVANQLDSIDYRYSIPSYYGTPIYFHSGWKYSFVPKHRPFQALISVANRTYSNDITVNLYKGGQLIKTTKNDAMSGVAKLMADIDTTVVTGTATDPVLTYEVLISDANTSSFESDSWIGQWTMPDGTSNSIVDGVDNPILFDFAIPSGWNYSFKPDHLPFDMSLFAVPYTEDGSNVTINFYVNHQLVKNASSRKQQRLTYTVR